MDNFTFTLTILNEEYSFDAPHYVIISIILLLHPS